MLHEFTSYTYRYRYIYIYRDPYIYIYTHSMGMWLLKPCLWPSKSILRCSHSVVIPFDGEAPHCCWRWSDPAQPYGIVSWHRQRLDFWSSLRSFLLRRWSRNSEIDCFQNPIISRFIHIKPYKPAKSWRLDLRIRALEIEIDWDGSVTLCSLHFVATDSCCVALRFVTELFTPITEESKIRSTISH